jgi:mannose-6-phosphate isomerase-like protein (cupin superfamily)/catechol 2,3-dioxygenase-like lactoylglutathione lyase family enzyme
MSVTLIQEEGLQQQITLQASINLQPETLSRKQAPRNPEANAHTVCRNTGVHHVGLHVKDPAASAEFFRDIFGMQLMGGTGCDHPIGATAFLSSRPDQEHHELALFANPVYAHTAFKVSSLDELRAMYERVVARGIPIRFTANHGCSFAIYFGDLDGNMIEVYWPTGDMSFIDSPTMEPIDFAQSNEALLETLPPQYREPAQAANPSGSASRRNQVKYVPAETGQAYWGPGDQIAFLITGEDTDGAFSLAEVSVPPGGGPGPHIHHREDESFQIMQGTLTVHVGGKTIVASSGDFVYLPRGVEHRFTNSGDVDAKFLVLITPAGLENFFFEAFYPALDRSKAPPLLTEDLLARLVAAAPKYGLEFVPPALQ